jgi:putative phosphoribosyl transferase
MMMMSQLAPGPSVIERPVRLELADVVLNADLALPPDPRGLVVFAHGSGSSRHSSRNRAVAEVLHQGDIGTLLLDLLTESEERTDVVTAEFRFDIHLLGARVVAASDWAGVHEATASLPLGLFGASTGAAAALIAAARRPQAVRAVVSRGGRPDLAGVALRAVVAPTLLIVGGRDEVVIEVNRQALDQLNAPKELRIIPGASHLFEEPGTLAHVAELARDWFASYL